MRTTSSLIVLATLLLAGLGTAVLLLLERAPGEVDEPGVVLQPTGPPGDAAPPPTTMRRKASGSTAERSAIFEPAPVEGAEPSVLDPAVEAARAGGTVTLVDARSGEPLPGATAWWWPKRFTYNLDDSFELWLRDSLVEEHLEEALELIADAEGRVRLPEGGRGCFVSAAAEGLWGYASFDVRPSEDARVELIPDVDLSVRVVDPGGAPLVGVPVAVREHLLRGSIDHLTARSQGPDGVAVLRHASWVLGRRSRRDSGLVVTLQALLDPAPELPLGHGAPPAEVVEFELEQTGSCEVLLVDARGQLVGGPLEGHLRFAEIGDGQAVPLSRLRGERLRSRSGGALVFEHVALGRELVATVFRDGASEPLESRGRGPRHPGERVQLWVRVDEDVALLRCRLLDSDGEPAADERVRVLLEAGEGSHAVGGDWMLSTDVEGRFTVQHPTVAEVPEGSGLVAQVLSDSGVPTAVARRSLPPALPAGSLELGDLRLDDLPLILAGTVVDEADRPVAGASVSAATVSVAAGGDSQGASSADWVGAVRSDAEGRFELRGECNNARLSLAARLGGLVADPTVVPNGAREVRLVLREAGAIEGWVLLDDSLRGAMILVQPVEQDGWADANSGAPPRPAVVEEEGRFVLRGLRSATYVLRFVYAATGAELGRVEGLVVSAGETTRDARIDPLDLSDTYRLIDLELLDVDGREVHGARAFSRPSGASEWEWTSCRREGSRLQALSDGRPLDVSISASGFAHALLEHVTASTSVTLRPAARLRLHLVGRVRPLEPPLQLGAELSPLVVGPRAELERPVQARFDAQGVLTCRSPFSGEVRVQLFVASNDPDDVPRIYLEEGAPRVLYVSDHAIEQDFEVTVDPAGLEAAVRSMKGQ